uniref:SERTA domain-containing protein n=1 Tax=Parascaris univalens TaxID=6257 RepID=A0A914ZE57_PARUN
MSNTSSDVDEIIENEVCNRLIRLSCAKMVNSKHERGGAKLHRNLLILHLLRRARNEQKRSTPSSPDDLDSSSELCSGSADTTESAQSSVSGDAKDVGVDQFGKETDHLLDLSCSSHADITAGNDPIELHVRDDDEVDYSTLSLEPLLLPFGTDAVEAEELSDMRAFRELVHFWCLIYSAKNYCYGDLYIRRNLVFMSLFGAIKSSDDRHCRYVSFPYWCISS